MTNIKLSNNISNKNGSEVASDQVHKMTAEEVRQANKRHAYMHERAKFADIEVIVDTENERLKRLVQLLCDHHWALSHYESVKFFQDHFNFSPEMIVPAEMGLYFSVMENLRELFLELHLEHARRASEFDLKHIEWSRCA